MYKCYKYFSYVSDSPRNLRRKKHSPEALDQERAQIRTLCSRISYVVGPNPNKCESNYLGQGISEISFSVTFSVKFLLNSWKYFTLVNDLNCQIILKCV